jgi:hypothetical protein
MIFPAIGCDYKSNRRRFALMNATQRDAAATKEP